VAGDILYVPSQQRYTRAASVTAADRVASVQVRGAGGAGVWVRAASEGRGPTVVHATRPLAAWEPAVKFLS
jgi:hypothetical protein